MQKGREQRSRKTTKREKVTKGEGEKEGDKKKQSKTFIKGAAVVRFLVAVDDNNIRQFIHAKTAQKLIRRKKETKNKKEKRECR